MIEKNKTLMTIEKIKAFAIGLIGSLFFTWGLTYFQDQGHYRVPRILLPVFEVFGNIGLAIGLLILGGGLMFFAYRKFIQNGGRSIVMMIMLPLLVVAAFTISKLTENSELKNGKDRMEVLKEKINVQPEKKNRPQIDNQLAIELLDKRENLLAEMNKAKNINDEAAFKSLVSQFWGTNKDYAKISMVIREDEKYVDFIVYNDQIINEVKMLSEN